MAATSKTIVRMWNKDGYHKDVLILDSDQVRMSESRVTETTGSMLCNSGGPFGPSMTIDPLQFPEAVYFQVMVVEYEKR